jgi:hypothetical protein
MGAIVMNIRHDAHTLVPASVAALGILFVVNSSQAATIFESGTLGPIGVTYADLGGTVPGTNISSTVFAGVRFEVTQPAVISKVGGHFVERFAGTFFGAIVKLNDATDFPDSIDLSTADLLGKTTLIFPNPSTEVFGDLNLSLNPGWYALVFGSGLFGATGQGGTVENGSDIGSPTYISYHLGDPSWSVPINPIFRNYRYVVLGELVPEPNSFVILVLALFPFGIRWRR